jgi:PAS domain S-box-containing protein
MFNQNFLKKLNILYVEDDPTARGKLSKIFERFFKNVLTAENGQDGLNIYKKSVESNITIDLIVSDINMPIMDGIEMLEKIREFDGDVPLIYTTARTETEMLLRAIELNVNFYAIKPIDIEEIFKRIELACQKKFYENSIKQKNIELEQQLQAIDTVAMIFKLDRDKKITSVNSMVTEVFEYTQEEMLEKPIEEFFHKDTDKNMLEKLWQDVSKGKTWHSNLKYANKEDEIFYINSTIFPVINDEGIEYRYIGFLSTKDVNDQREFRKQVMNTYLEYRKKEDSLNKQIDTLESELKTVHIGDEYQSNLIKELEEKNKALKAQLYSYEKADLNKKDANDRKTDLTKQKIDRLADLAKEATNRSSALEKEMKILKEDYETKKLELLNQDTLIENQKKIIKELKELLKDSD